MRSACTVMSRTTRSAQVLHVVEQDRGVREDHALGAGVRDVALVPQGDVLHRGRGVAAQHAGQPADALGEDRVALVGHGARTLLPLPERLLDLPAPRCAGGGAPRWRSARGPRRPARSLRAAPRGGRGPPPAWRPAPAPGPAAPARAPRRPARARSACPPPPRSPPPRPGQTPARGGRALRWASKAKPASFRPKVVGSAWTPCVRPTQSVSRCSRARSTNAATSSRAPGRIASPAALSWRASPVSTTSELVSPKWIHRPAGPADSARTSTKAAARDRSPPRAPGWPRA